MKIRIMGERYLIKQYVKEDFKDGVFIPSAAQDERTQGVVIDKGEGALLSNNTHAPMFCEIGDTVLFTKFSGTPVGLTDENGKKDETFLMVNQRDLLAIVKLTDNHPEDTDNRACEAYEAAKDNRPAAGAAAPAWGSGADRPKTYVVPLGERYIVKRYEPETKTASGIMIPKKSAETRFQGTVCAVAQGICLENGSFTPMLYKTGQSVLFVRFAGTPIKINMDSEPEEFLILNQRDILCVVE